MIYNSDNNKIKPYPNVMNKNNFLPQNSPPSATRKTILLLFIILFVRHSAVTVQWLVINIYDLHDKITAERWKGGGPATKIYKDSPR